MKKGMRIWRRLAGPALAAMVFVGPVASGLSAADRFRVDVFGGLATLDPRDLNLLGKAEEQYNYLLFQERLFGYSGYFTRDKSQAKPGRTSSPLSRSMPSLRPAAPLGAY